MCGDQISSALRTGGENSSPLKDTFVIQLNSSEAGAVPEATNSESKKRTGLDTDSNSVFGCGPCGTLSEQC